MKFILNEMFRNEGTQQSWAHAHSPRKCIIYIQEQESEATEQQQHMISSHDTGAWTTNISTNSYRSAGLLTWAANSYLTYVVSAKHFQI